MVHTNALSVEERMAILANTGIDDLKYWFEYNQYEGDHFTAFIDYLYDNQPDYLEEYIKDIICDTERNDDEDFLDICKHLDIEVKGKAKIIADYYDNRHWSDEPENFVDCTILFNDRDEEEEVTIALKSLEELGWVEGDSNDDKIFFFCDSIEDFFNLCDEDYTCEDFVVTDVDYFHNNL